MKLDAQGQRITPKINIYDALPLFKARGGVTNIQRKFGVGYVAAQSVVSKLASEGLIEEVPTSRGSYRLTLAGQERNGVTW